MKAVKRQNTAYRDILVEDCKYLSILYTSKGHFVHKQQNRLTELPLVKLLYTFAKLSG